MESLQQICTFRIDDHFFGVPIESVQEVIRSPEVTRVPRAHPAVRGLINLRGQLLIAVDLRHRMNLGTTDMAQKSVNVVLRTEDDVLALIVDAMDDVLELTEDQFEPPPETVDADVRSLIRGVYKLEGRLLLLLNIENAIDVNAVSEIT